jgi:hypothetical protein
VFVLCGVPVTIEFFYESMVLELVVLSMLNILREFFTIFPFSVHAGENAVILGSMPRFEHFDNAEGETGVCECCIGGS